MAWPFSTPVAPTLDTGFVAVPTSSTSITTATSYLLGANFANTGTVNRTITITDTAGNQIADEIDVPPGVPVPIEWPFLPTAGVKWFASGAGIVGKVWGY